MYAMAAERIITMMIRPKSVNIMYSGITASNMVVVIVKMAFSVIFSVDIVVKVTVWVAVSSLVEIPSRLVVITLAVLPINNLCS